MPEVLSTRLFPKGRGADAYRITGIAARCDWVVASDGVAPHATVVRRVEDPPRTVFVSLRSPVHALRCFVESVLPRCRHPFVLVTGSEDVTVPTQLDRRWPSFDAETQARIATILAHPLLLRWHAENLDVEGDARFAPLPLGRVFPDGSTVAWPPSPPPATGSRPPRVLCAHRVRPGPQWEPRRVVDQLARGPWHAWCTVPDGELDESAFEDQLRAHAFVLCVEGGGLDPSPKAWQAIAAGAIPIVRRTALAPAYARLPVAFVDAWRPEAIDAGHLAAWQARLAPEHDDPVRRGEVVTRLGLDYWWARITAELH